MALWDQLKSRTQTMSTQLKAKSDQFRSKEFAAGSMAMCALVAAADGSIDPAERERTASLIENNDVLKVHPAADLRQKFDFYSDKLNKDFEFGKVEAIGTIAKLKGKPDQARGVIQIGIIIGGADGNFDANERRAVAEACNAVGIPPAEFDL
ncbi:tellurite resistance TerB family protein [Jatrophihabitans sp. YIM 134969]